MPRTGAWDLLMVMMLFSKTPVSLPAMTSLKYPREETLVPTSPIPSTSAAATTWPLSSNTSMPHRFGLALTMESHTAWASSTAP